MPRLPDWQNSRQKVRLPGERRFAATFNHGRVVPEIDEINNNLEDYPDLKEYFAVVDSGDSQKDRRRASRANGERNAIVLHTRNPLVEDSSGCPRRRNNKRTVFDDHVVGDPLRTDNQWYRCTGCVFLGGECKVRPIGASQDHQLSSNISSQTADQAMDQSIIHATASANVRQDDITGAELSSEGSSQLAVPSTASGVANDRDNTRASSREEIKVEDEHVSNPQEATTSMQNPDAIERSADISTPQDNISTNTQERLAAAQRTASASATSVLAPAKSAIEWHQTAQEMLLEVESRHEHELHYLKQEAAERLDDVEQKANDQRIAAIIELTIEFQNRIIDLERQNEDLLERNQRLGNELEEKEKHHLQLQQELQHKFEAATKEILDLKNAFDAEKQKATNAQTKLVNDAMRERQMKAYYTAAANQTAQTHTATVARGVQKAKDEASAGNVALRKSLKETWKRETADLIQENRTLKGANEEMQIALAENELLVLKLQDERYSLILAKEREIVDLKEKSVKRVAETEGEDAPERKRYKRDN